MNYPLSPPLALADFANSASALNVNDLSTQDFEQSILQNTLQLNTLERETPLKTLEEINREWMLERLGKFTASEFHRLTTAPTKKELPVGAITYATEKAVELLTEYLDDHYTSKDMQWGLDHELDAITAFEQRTGLIAYQTGSKQKLMLQADNSDHETASVGGTPDGLIADNAGIEIKCPKSTTHFKYLSIKNQEDLKANCANYYWQIQGLLSITGRQHWYFVSYDPRYQHQNQQLHFIKVIPDKDDQHFLAKRLAQAIAYRDHILIQAKGENSPLINLQQVQQHLHTNPHHLGKLRKENTFPEPIKKRPLLWREVDISTYAMTRH